MVPFYQLENRFIRICGDGVISCGHSMDDYSWDLLYFQDGRNQNELDFLTNEIIITIRCQWNIQMALRMKLS